MPDKININELRRLHAASSQGKWHAVRNAYYSEIRFDNGKYLEQVGDMCASVHIGPGDDPCNLELSDANATFCAAAHNAMPGLLDRLERAEAALEQISNYDTMERSRDPRTRIAREALGE